MLIRLAIAVAWVTCLGGCGATISDPLAVQAMVERCAQQHERDGKVSSPVLPVLPVLACR